MASWAAGIRPQSRILTLALSDHSSYQMSQFGCLKKQTQLERRAQALIPLRPGLPPDPGYIS